MKHCRQTEKKGQQGKKEQERLALLDRYQTYFPVRTVCSHCYNEIYNSLPLSLHEYSRSLLGEAPAGLRLIFTTENAEELRQVLSCYRGFFTENRQSRQAAFPYTRGHYKRGAE